MNAEYKEKLERHYKAFAKFFKEGDEIPYPCDTDDCDNLYWETKKSRRMLCNSCLVARLTANRPHRPKPIAEDTNTI